MDQQEVYRSSTEPQENSQVTNTNQQQNETEDEIPEVVFKLGGNPGCIGIVGHLLSHNKTYYLPHIENIVENSTNTPIINGLQNYIKENEIKMKCPRCHNVDLLGHKCSKCYTYVL